MQSYLQIAHSSIEWTLGTFEYLHVATWSYLFVDMPVKLDTDRSSDVANYPLSVKALYKDTAMTRYQQTWWARMHACSQDMSSSMLQPYRILVFQGIVWAYIIHFIGLLCRDRSKIPSHVADNVVLHDMTHKIVKLQLLMQLLSQPHHLMIWWLVQLFCHLSFKQQVPSRLEYIWRWLQWCFWYKCQALSSAAIFGFANCQNSP